ncbi:MAG: DUF4347 domain-containing protein, partial [Phycisphaerae bacterium]|nr:DUF4347 domain-containing protein [Phycisphaerae bacterium]
MGIGSWLRQGRKTRGTRHERLDVPIFEQLEPRLLLSADASLLPEFLPLNTCDEQAVCVDLEVASGGVGVGSEDSALPEATPLQVGSQEERREEQPKGLPLSEIETAAGFNVTQQIETQSSLADTSGDSTLSHPSPFALHTSDLDPAPIRGPPAMAQSVNTAQEILFVDSAVEHDFQPPNAETSRVEVVVLDDTQDGIQQITQSLSDRTNISAIHIISHGAPGRIHLGTVVLETTSLDTYADMLQTWGIPLTQDGDLLFYGCSVAKGDSGVSLIDRIAQLTGADVGASIDPTGSFDLGGDWVLEQTTGTIEAALPFNLGAFASFSGLLNVDATIVVGDHYLLPDTANQRIEITVSSADAVTGMNVRAMIGDGHGPTIEGDGGSDEPVFTGVDFTGGIWDTGEELTVMGGLVDVRPPKTGSPVLQSSIVFNRGPERNDIGEITAPGASTIADGLAMTFIIDTTGFTEYGEFDLKLSSVYGENTNMLDPKVATGSIDGGDYVESGGDAIDVNVTNGRIIIDPSGPVIITEVPPNDTIPEATLTGIGPGSGSYGYAGVIGDNPNVAPGLDVDMYAF